MDTKAARPPTGSKPFMQRRPPEHRPGRAVILVALGLVPLWVVMAAVMSLGEGFCEDSESAEACASEASDNHLVLIGLAIVIGVMFLVGVVLASRQVPPHDRGASHSDL